MSIAHRDIVAGGKFDERKCFRWCSRSMFGATKSHVSE